MIVGIQASRNFSDYSVFLRAMGTALASVKTGDSEFTIMSAGPVNINAMAAEFSNISERSLKAQGIKIKVVKVPPKWFKSNMHVVNHFMYFSLPKETPSELVREAEDKDIDVGIYRYA
jgi:hypothetical protein